jgi:ABC-type polysaccharide/polyol phosphate export permease
MMKMVPTPPKRRKFFQGETMIRLLKNLKELYKYRVLIQSLVSRELKARYRGTILGFFWSFFNPLLLLIVYSIVFGLMIGPRDPAFGGSPWMYSLFLFCGLLPWQVWFSASAIESSNILMIQGNLIKKILFPVEILPIVVVTSNFMHFLFGLPILLLFVPILGGKFSIYLLFLPVVILVQFVFTLGFAFFISSLTVHFRDIKDILTNLLTFWFFGTPIIYPMTFAPVQKSSLFKTLLNLNPMTHIMQGYQSSVFHRELIHWKRLGVTFLVSLVLFFVGYYIFDRLRDSFPEEV